MIVTVTIDLSPLDVAALSAICRTLGRYDLDAQASDEARAAHTVQIMASSMLMRPIRAMADAYLAGNHDVTEWPGAEPGQNSIIH